jgi:hypothetical protein
MNQWGAFRLKIFKSALKIGSNAVKIDRNAKN